MFSGGSRSAVPATFRSVAKRATKMRHCGIPNRNDHDHRFLSMAASKTCTILEGKSSRAGATVFVCIPDEPDGPAANRPDSSFVRRTCTIFGLPALRVSQCSVRRREHHPVNGASWLCLSSDYFHSTTLNKRALVETCLLKNRPWPCCSITNAFIPAGGILGAISLLSKLVSFGSRWMLSRQHMPVGELMFAI